MAYYENSRQLQRQYELLRSMPDYIKAHLRVIVVDDCSEKAPAHKFKMGVPLEVFRIKPPKVQWNQDAARNIGVANTITPWVLLTDMDHMVPLATWESLICQTYYETQVYKFRRVSAPDMSPYKPHPNSWFMTKAMYDRLGGYDERFAGVYGTDGDFRNRLKEITEITEIEQVLIRVPREVVADASTTQFPRKTPESGDVIKRVKTEREAIPGWRPLTLQFPYERVA